MPRLSSILIHGVALGSDKASIKSRDSSRARLISRTAKSERLKLNVSNRLAEPPKAPSLRSFRAEPTIVHNHECRTTVRLGALSKKPRAASGTRIGFDIGIAHGFATLGTIGYEGRFDYAAIGTVSNVASRLCDEAKPGQILISPRVLTKVENAVKVEPVGEFELKGIRRPLAAYNVVATVS